MDNAIPLSSNELMYICSTTQVLNRSFYGIVTPSIIDTLLLPVNSFVIIFFSHPRDSIGHWTTLYRNTSSFEFFDSSCNPSFLLIIKQFLNSTYSRPILRSLPFHTQDSRTKTCGYFCLYFLYNRIRCSQKPFGAFLQEYFYLSTYDNELTVLEFSKEHGFTTRS